MVCLGGNTHFTMINDVDIESVKNVDFSFGDFELVGHGEVTNEKCGLFSGRYLGCLRVELHNKVGLDGVNYAGKIYGVAVFHSCDKPSCPVCYKYGWAVREANRVTVRLREASKRFGLAEHIVVSPPRRLYHLSYEALKKKVVEACKRRGVLGGVLIFHGFRLKKPQIVWYWSPHFHVLGFIEGGMRRCRRCSKHGDECKGCGGFIDRNYRCYEKDGFIFKVKGKRKSVYHTAWYILNHASHKKNSTRFHVATWFGVVSYRKMKIESEDRKRVCPICGHDLVKIRYCGMKRGSCIRIYGGGFVGNFEEEGFIRGTKEVVWQEVVSGSHKYRGEY